MDYLLVFKAADELLALGNKLTIYLFFFCFHVELFDCGAALRLKPSLGVDFIVRVWSSRSRPSLTFGFVYVRSYKPSSES